MNGTEETPQARLTPGRLPGPPRRICS